jgi:thiol-disulfide isomerase/thioredoxin
MSMRKCVILVAISIGAVFGAGAARGAETIVSLVHGAAAEGHAADANRLLQVYRSSQGVTPEYIEALSWIGRVALGNGQTAAAEANAAEVRKLCEAQLAHRKLDAEPHLAIALGASIEVQAQALGKEGRRDEAVLLLRDELKHWQGTSIVTRIQKMNLLTLEGKPAPAGGVAGSGWSQASSACGPSRTSRADFPWAHWCPDCKAEVDNIQKLMAVDGPKGLVVVAPTQHYGRLLRKTLRPRC